MFFRLLMTCAESNRALPSELGGCAALYTTCHCLPGLSAALDLTTLVGVRFPVIYKNKKVGKTRTCFAAGAGMTKKKIFKNDKCFYHPYDSAMLS